MIAASLSAIIDDALGATDREVDDIDSAWLLRVAKRKLRDLWSLFIRLNPDQFTKTSSSFTITSGNTHTIGTGDGVADYLSFRGLEYDPGSGLYAPLRPYRFRDRANAPWLSYRVFNGVIDVQPTQLAGTYPLRFKYIFQPTFTSEGTDSQLDLPLGAEEWLVEAIAAKIRVRFEEPPDDHLTAQAIAMMTVNRFLVGHDQGPPDALPMAGDFDDEPGMGDL